MKAIKYFTAPWCGPCKTFGPIMEELQFEGVNIQKINIDTQQGMAVEYSVKSIPTCVFIDSRGEEVDRLVGTQPKDVVKQKYDAIQ